MADRKHHDQPAVMIKVVYFDEQSASDYLDITSGGKIAATSQDVRDRTTEMQARVETSLAAKFSWLPFLGASGEMAASADISRIGHTILSKTLSNTILTDYLAKVTEDHRVPRLRDLKVTAPRDSMAYMKMYTPYMVIAKTDDADVDLTRLDEALEGAKGYYELLGESSDRKKHVLRFNIKAFRNNYGLADLVRMRLVFHGVLVGQTEESELSLEAEMSTEADTREISALEIVDGRTDAARSMLDVYDVILAGVEWNE